MNTAEFDPRQADANYRSFPSFEEWSKCVVDTDRWTRYSSLLEKRSGISAEELRRAREVVKRAAAMDTGAIEGLYETDRDFTFTVATMAADWEALLDSKGPQLRQLYAAQLKAYDYVVDLATQSEPISEAAIRALHQEVCEAQETYTAWTEIGLQELRLPKGEYKHLPNHVIGRDGKLHAYAPVDLTPVEMHRLCQELRSEAFINAHPVLQASWAHYAFVVIHPFADGNGRVARALGSVFTVRSHSVPLLILQENREQYLASLSAADAGDYQRFVDFIFERAVDAMRLVDESLRAALAPSIEDAAAALKQLYKTRGGYTHHQVDEAGHRLFRLFYDEVERQARASPVAEVTSCEIEGGPANHQPGQESLRLPVQTHLGISQLRFRLHSQPPAEASVERQFALEVPRDCDRDDELIIRNLVTGESFAARMNELVPVETAALQMRLTVAVQRILAEAVSELSRRATESLRQKGY
jgi:Fic family protein